MAHQTTLLVDHGGEVSLSIESTHAGVRPMLVALDHYDMSLVLSLVLSEDEIRFLHKTLTAFLGLDATIQKPD